MPDCKMVCQAVALNDMLAAEEADDELASKVMRTIASDIKQGGDRSILTQMRAVGINSAFDMLVIGLWLCCLITAKFGSRYGVTARISSLSRTPELNDAIKGRKASEHTKNRAVDIYMAGVEGHDKWEEIAKFVAGHLKERGLSWGWAGWYLAHVHVDFPESNPSCSCSRYSDPTRR